MEMKMKQMDPQFKRAPDLKSSVITRGKSDSRRWKDLENGLDHRVYPTTCCPSALERSA